MTFCTKLDDLILNMRDDEALDRKEEDAPNKTKSITNWWIVCIHLTLLLIMLPHILVYQH
jgi:hypothetical protein